MTEDVCTNLFESLCARNAEIVRWVAQIKGPSPKADIGGGLDIPKTLGGGTLKEMGKDASNAVSSAMHSFCWSQPTACIARSVCRSLVTGIAKLMSLWSFHFALTT